MSVGLSGVSGGAPLQEPAPNPQLVPDGDFVIPAGSCIYSQAPGAQRAWTLPLLANVGPGTVIGVKNQTAPGTNIVVTAAGTDQVNDAGAPGAFTVTGGLGVFFVARRIQNPGGVSIAASWVTL